MKARVEGPQDLADPLVFAEFLRPVRFDDGDGGRRSRSSPAASTSSTSSAPTSATGIATSHTHLTLMTCTRGCTTSRFHREVRYRIFDSIGLGGLEQALDFEQVDPVLSFVRTLLTEWRWDQLEGRDLLVLDPTGESSTLPAVFTWDTPADCRLRHATVPADHATYGGEAEN